MWHKIFHPNIITLARIALLIPILILLHFSYPITSFILTIIAIFTDFLDGKIARKFNLTTPLGAILDPIADKVLILVFISFFYFQGVLPIWFVLLANTRDILQLIAIPILLFYKKIMFKVKPKLLPKIATAVKFLIILYCFTLEIFNISFQFNVIFIFSTFLELYILLTFISRFIKIYYNKHDTFE